MMKRIRENSKHLLSIALLAALVATGGCTESGQHEQAICVLIDISGTYADQKLEVVKVIKREILPAMVPGDTLITVLIDSESYEKQNLTTLTTLDPRPSKANAQKLAIAQQLDEFAASDVRSSYSDIPGAMMLGAEYLQEAEGGTRVMLVFSDMREELPDGARRTLRDDEFAGIEVVAMNVKRLGPDSADPEIYRKRLETWEAKVKAAGGSGWLTLLNAGKLPGVLEAMRS